MSRAFSQKEKFPLQKYSGILAIKNLETQKIWNLFVDDLIPPNKIDHSVITDSGHKHSFLDIGHYAAICSKLIILLSTKYPIEEQLRKISSSPNIYQTVPESI